MYATSLWYDRKVKVMPQATWEFYTFYYIYSIHILVDEFIYFVIYNNNEKMNENINYNNKKESVL